MMKVPPGCGKRSSFDSDDAGWYVPNSVVPGDIYPVWRSPGGGVGSDHLFEYQDLDKAYDRAIALLHERKRETERLIDEMVNAKNKHITG